jgi:HEXXH motif-containing protein
MARRVLQSPLELRRALWRDPALGRWTAGVERALQLGDTPGLSSLLMAASRFEIAQALALGADAKRLVALGPSGHARIPMDGRVLHGAPGRPLLVEVREGQLHAPTLPGRKAGPLEVVDEDAEAGARPALPALSGRCPEAITQRLAAGVACLSESSPALLEELGAFSPVLIPLSGASDVSLSGSQREARGSIWLTPVDRPLVIAETLVHESSHLKFFFLEDESPWTLDDDPPRFAVPWRSDLRPLRAVLMGLHAWVRVLNWLATLSQGPYAQPAAQRITILRQATDAAATILSEAEGLTPAGEALVHQLIKAVQEQPAP